MSNETDLLLRFRAAHTACALLALKLRPKFASLLDTLEDLTTVYAGASIEIKAEAQDDRLQLLQALEAQGAPDAVVSDAESVSRDVPACRQQTAMPAPRPSAKRLCNDPLAPEAANVDWVFGIGIPKKRLKLHESIDSFYSLSPAHKPGVPSSAGLPVARFFEKGF